MSLIDDPEIKAMNIIFETLKELDESMRARVLNWTLSKFGHSPVKTTVVNPASQAPSNVTGSIAGIAAYPSLAEAFSAASPNTDVEKVLVVAAYLQESQQKSDLTGFEINKELNHLGHSVTNITSTIGVLMSRKPQLMIQTKKDGKTKQAKKKYKVTVEGIRFVDAMSSNKS